MSRIWCAFSEFFWTVFGYINEWFSPYFTWVFKLMYHLLLSCYFLLCPPLVLPYPTSFGKYCRERGNRCRSIMYFCMRAVISLSKHRYVIAFQSLEALLELWLSCSVNTENKFHKRLCWQKGGNSVVRDEMDSGWRFVVFFSPLLVTSCYFWINLSWKLFYAYGRFSVQNNNLTNQ